MPGEEECTPCSFATFNNKTGSTSCTLCEKEYYTKNLGDTECVECPIMVFDVSNSRCLGNQIIALLFTLLVIYVVSTPLRHKLQSEKRARKAKKRRFKYSLLEVYRSNGTSVNQKHRPPIGRVSARSLAGLKEKN